MSINVIEKYKLTKEQTETYLWLNTQNLNTDDGTLSYWVKKYPLKRIKEVVIFAKSRIEAGQNISNIGGWINQFLKNGLEIVDDNCKLNREYLTQFIRATNWRDLKIYEKYIRDTIIEEDLSLTMNSNEFRRHLEAFYQRSQLYKPYK
jgi:hypothetical protein